MFKICMIFSSGLHPSASSPAFITNILWITSGRRWRSLASFWDIVENLLPEMAHAGQCDDRYDKTDRYQNKTCQHAQEHAVSTHGDP